MPPTAATLRVGRYFLSLLIIFIVLFGLVFLPGQRHTPKLGLDLEGGKQIVLQAKKPGGGIPTPASMAVARAILTDRVNGKGVSAAEVQQEGQDRIVISVPGKNNSDLSGIEKSAQLNFRPLMFPPIPPQTAPTPSGTPAASGSTAPPGSVPSGVPATTTGKPAPTTATSTAAGGLVQPLLAPVSSTAATPAPATKTTAKAPAVSTAASASPTPSAAPVQPEVQNPFTGLGFALPTTDVQFNALPTTQQSQLAAALQRFKCGSKPDDIPGQPLAACDRSGLKYLLGPVIVAGSQIQTAGVQAPSSQSSLWQVSLTLKDSGDKAWSKYTGAHHSDPGTVPPLQSCSAATTPCAEYVGFTLDGDVVSTPHNQAVISGIATLISGDFTQKTATELANQLKYGALPLSLAVLTNSDVSATLGAGQLHAGLLAGGIGLFLVVIYSLLYYRALGLVTIASLLVSGVLTYGALVVLGREMGFTLTLAGIAGFIVAVGITADSFVVLFERLKDEVHGGRSMRVAVPRAWTRARRTILSADTVSFLAAAVLYYFAAGDVRGFAFTLGLSTILDLVVVFLFTHPLVSLLSRSRAFGSPRFTGLNSVRTGGPAVVPTLRPAKDASRPRRRAGATALGAAVLEREPGVDDQLDGHAAGELADEAADSSADLGDVIKAPATELATGFASAPGADKRTSTAIGASAAYRAAARRGRAVRVPKPEADSDSHPREIDGARTAVDRKDVVIAPAVEAGDDVATSHGGATAVSVSDNGHADDSDTDTDIADEVADEPARGLFGRLRSRAGRTTLPSDDDDEPAFEAADARPVDAGVDDHVNMSKLGRPNVDVVDDVTAPPVPHVVQAAEPTPTSAAQRAAARRTRIRSRAADPSSAAAEDES